MSMNFDRAAGYYDQTRGYPPEIAAAIGDALARLVHAGPATRFLEIGVGTGRIALPVAQLGYEYTGVDISQAMLDRLREKAAPMRTAEGRPLRLSVQQADMQQLPFVDHSFDVVIAAHVFHLVADACAAATEAMRVLRPGGALLMCGDHGVAPGADSVDAQWRAIVREQYGSLPNSRDATAQVAAYLLEQDPALQVEEHVLVRWDSTATAAGELDAFRRRLWSNTWRLPDDVYQRCLAQLEAWGAVTFAGRMDEPVRRSSEFVVRLIRRRIGG